MDSLRVIDSHTGGEPTRVVLPGQIELAGDTMSERLDDLRTNYDHIRTASVCEPRGSEVVVGALLTAPVNEGSTAGIIFFNTAGYLGMCGHGTIGVVETLRHLGSVTFGEIKLDTPVGTVTVHLLDSGEAAMENVLSYRYLRGIELDVDGIGRVRGDVAYGGNWFFIVHEPRFEIEMRHEPELRQQCTLIRKTLKANGITGKGGAEIDHIELFDSGNSADYDSKNYVQCPSGAYDRSPCGTGTSAKLACLHASGILEPGQEYRQASITGSIFRGSVQPCEGGVVPTIIGRAFITGESNLIFDANDPIRWGFGS